MADVDADVKRFAKLVVTNGLATKEQVMKAIELQKKNPQHSVGRIMVAKGFLSEDDFKKVLKALQSGGGQSSRRAPAQPAKDTLDEGSPLKNMLKLMHKAADLGVSDLQINSGSTPMMRHNGHIKNLNMPVLDAQTCEGLLFSIMSEEEQAQFKKDMDIDLTFELEGKGRFRINIFKQQNGMDGSFRYIPKEVPTLEELGIPKVIERMTHYTQGLVLITGPAGCGKTSTLAALIRMINENRKENIITLEEPIEYVIPSINCNVIQRQIPRDSLEFGNALRASLREDPDVIMVGEMRDRDTIHVAITAAETGHLVLGSLHTSSAPRTVDRVLDVFPPKEASQVRAMISESLRGVIAQQLIPRADGSGRVVACEILFNTPAIANLIREERTYQILGVLQTQRKIGMQTMDDALQELVKKRLISKDDAYLRAENKANFL